MLTPSYWSPISLSDKSSYLVTLGSTLTLLALSFEAETLRGGGGPNMTGWSQVCDELRLPGCRNLSSSPLTHAMWMAKIMTWWASSHFHRSAFFVVNLEKAAPSFIHIKHIFLKPPNPHSCLWCLSSLIQILALMGKKINWDTDLLITNRMIELIFCSQGSKNSLKAHSKLKATH